MTPFLDFVTNPARASKSYVEIKEMVESMYGKDPQENVNLCHNQEGEE
jgi:hypothetical protein